jgi:ubiquinone biosynthesis protein Coq4
MLRDKFVEYWRKVPQVTRIARRAEFVLNIYFEEHLDDPLEQFRLKYGYEAVN